MLTYLLIFGLPTVLVLGVYLLKEWNNSHSALKKLDESISSGLTEPASLHPVIDPNRCLGCGTCVSACPEGEILGLVKRKAQLVSPTSCIGHGACREACPTNAITLVFGTATRGVEIPLLSKDFETSVAGIFIAGELGGMGLIKNAIAQGTQAIDAIVKTLKRTSEQDYDVVIVGAGPAGLSAALAAKDKKLKYLVLEQDTIGGTLAHYPRGKIVMTRPAVLPIIGKFQFKEASKESLIGFWQQAIKTAKLVIKTGERVDNIEKQAQGFKVTTPKNTYSTKSILLALGRRGTPRKLGVPGEELSKVVYTLTEPEQYAGRHVVVVGGGDSALEAALAIAEQPNTHTILSYRNDAFSRAKPKNRERVAQAKKDGRLKVWLGTQIKQISAQSLQIETPAGVKEIKNDDLIVCAGGILPTPFLKKIGIHVEEKFGTA